MRRLLLIAIVVIRPFLLSAQTDAVTFSQTGGFYEESFTLSLHCGEGNHIRYTTNGDRPTSSSTLYSDPIKLDTALYSKSNIYTIVNCIPSIFYQPNTVQKAIVIRAAAFNETDSCVSAVATHSYFIHSLGCDFHGLPVVSIVTDSLSLFDHETGIFVPGIHYVSSDSTHTGNYCQRGRDWERLVNLEFYETDNSGINQTCGLRTHGGASRWFQQKGMKLYARDDYGKKRFRHHFFETTTLSNFKRLNLRPFRCSNWLQTGAQEYLSQTVAANLDIETLGVRQTVVFINGEYWGIYTLEESPDEHYIEDHYDVDLDQVNLIKYWSVSEHGDGTDWEDFRTWIKTANLSLPDDSAYAYARVDINNLTDYLLFETFSANLDWPHNNVELWQPETGTPFRWIFFDGDGCFTKSEYNAIGSALQHSSNGLILRKFLECPGFKEAFRKRYKQLQGAYLSPSYMQSVLDRFRQSVEGEITAQCERFRFPESIDRWRNDMDKASAFLANRHSYFNNELLEFISIKEMTVEDFCCSPNPSSGSFTIKANLPTDTSIPLEIYDITGRKVYCKELCLQGQNNTIPVNVDLPSGLYFLKLDHIVERIVIQ